MLVPVTGEALAFAAVATVGAASVTVTAAAVHGPAGGRDRGRARRIRGRVQSAGIDRAGAAGRAS